MTTVSYHIIITTDNILCITTIIVGSVQGDLHIIIPGIYVNDIFDGCVVIVIFFYSYCCCCSNCINISNCYYCCHHINYDSLTKSQD